MYEILNQLLQIKNNNNFYDEIFKILSEVISFDSGAIFFYNPDRLEYAFNPANEKFETLSKELFVENTTFGKIEIYGKIFTLEDKKKFKTCSLVISKLIKDVEISKIMKMQVKALEEGYKELRELNVKLEEAEKVKTKFLSHVSHELRTPLNSILGYSDLLSNEFVGKLNNKQKDYINDIKISGINLLEMVNEILDMSKIEANSMKLVINSLDIVQLVEDVENTIKPLLLKKKIDFEKDIENFSINADYQKLQQILFNLLSNAIKYTSQGGNIKLSAKLRNNEVEICVKDDGIGIAKENQDKVFEKFEQLDKATSNSTGLGLTITKELVKLHNGTINLISEINKGCEFIIKIPR